MNSQILTGVVSHVRNGPQKHHFKYPVYFYRFDVDELPELDKTIPGFGYNRFSIVRMDDKDYLWPGKQILKDKIGSVLEKIGWTEPVRRIELISFARYWNIIFRPVSFFVCYNQENQCRLILAEVHNTFGETHLYVLKEPQMESQTLCFKISKAFHVSPFFDRNGFYRILFKDDQNSLDIGIQLIHPELGDKPVFFARLTGQGRPLTAGTLYRTLAQYPFNAMLNMPRILRQAMTLYFRKKLPVFHKPVPDSTYTMRKQGPSWLARQGMHVIFSWLEKQSADFVVVTLPDGQRRSFGSQGTDASVDLQVRDYRFFSRLAAASEIGLGIAYEKGYWLSDNLVGLMKYLLCASLSQSVMKPWYSRFIRMFYLAWYCRNRNTLTQAKKNIEHHYDLSNDMYKLFLDETMTYSCAIFEYENEPLSQAQLRKIDRILDKVCLCADHHVLEIGTGWGGLAIRAVQRFGCRVTTITLSKEQQQSARQRIEQAGLSDRIEVLLCDYRKVTGQYDRIVSVEMLEAVGKAYYPDFFQSCDRLLKDNGILVIQTITIPDQRYEAYSKTTDWMRLFIFPGGLLPSLTALTQTMTRHTSFVVKHVESIGPHYALTLARWRERFLANRENILAMGFPETFIQRWDYYFSYCQAGFARHYVDDLQIVLTRPGNPDCIRLFERNIKQNKMTTDSAP